jgi:hypothetical protein
MPRTRAPSASSPTTCARHLRHRGRGAALQRGGGLRGAAHAAAGGALWARAGHARELLRALAETVIDLFARSTPTWSSARCGDRGAGARKSKFKGTLERGLRQVQRVWSSAARRRRREADQRREAFDLFETYGFPLPLTVELAREQGLAVDEAGFRGSLPRSTASSRQGSEQKFKGGLADHAGRPPACTPPRTCCTRRCARCWGRACARWARTSPPSGCASTSRTPSG